MGTHWLGEDFLRPLPERINRQRATMRPTNQHMQARRYFAPLLLRHTGCLAQLQQGAVS